ncbi:potassium transporter TrkA [Megasphaera cerevisiae DSM 20462]|uniref:Trk system potassium uptake protein TrkA n=1 Tax=Megasphaera cerevisiae DSM 20462 TaxID=1122219 RepID=A0A0J6WTF3_9FIRM|nr:Trk system potassium transporter TrkA [Megasphaera cerevisiae]KMO86815.1 potassium transporter TrkA [Megasphaera cerevisiae DSM 20462]MCI1750729.1 Trk system potassium transporter TrkA [Megasphaera cerevisiae]OKY53908.1 Trk system potassium transport protein TrkA [Megasphaera cerevisiae]SJZ35845.1 trk system potassium uptake protein TrkA [Megasphaera cerevisiae DSM 20462]
MRIVIVGAGKLGYSIAELLSNEQYDVVVVDNDEDHLEAVKNTLDVLTIAANGASPVTMNDPDIRAADILVAVTAIDEINIVACILAKKYGIKYTAARIRDMQFLSGAGDYLKQNFDIDLALNPEFITASEINRILMTPAALNVEDFANGKVRLFETKVRRKSPFINIPFKNMNIPPSVLVGMIFRDHRMIIPHGDDRLLPHDNAYFIGDADAVKAFSKSFVQSDMLKVERAIIIGAGRAGRFLAPMLDQQDVKVKIFDKNKERCLQVAEKLINGMAICGDGTDIDLLEQEGIADADAVICLTEDDRLNLMLALIAKHLGAKKTVVRISRNEYGSLMEKVGVDIVLSTRLLSASEVLAFARRGGVVSVSLLEGAKAEAVEVIVQEGALVAGRRLMEIGLPRECLVCAYVRDGEAYIPNGQSVLQAGDRIILFVQKAHSKSVMKYFKGRD